MEKEDLSAKELLQGTWIDDMTETPLLKFKGDTLYYINESVQPVTFKIIKDSLKTFGQQTTSYQIKKIGEYNFWIQTSIGDILKLSKAENSIDALLTVQESNEPEPTKEVIEKAYKVLAKKDLFNDGYNFEIVSLETGSPYNTTSCGIIKGKEDRDPGERRGDRLPGIRPRLYR